MKITVKKVFLYVCIGVLAYFALSFLIGGKKSHEIQYWKDKVTEITNIQKADEEMHRAAIGELEKKIDELNGNIDSSNSIIAGLNEADDKKARRIAELQDALDETKPLPEQITNLKEQVFEWKGRFQIAQGVIAEKDTIIFNLTAKYEAQVSISKNFEGLYIDTKTNLEACQREWSRTIKELGICRTKVKVNKLLLAGVGALGLVLALKS